MEVEGNQTTGKTSIAGWNTGGTDRHRWDRQTDRQAYIWTDRALREQKVFLKGHFVSLSGHGVFIPRLFPGFDRTLGTCSWEHKRVLRNTKMFLQGLMSQCLKKVQGTYLEDRKNIFWKKKNKIEISKKVNLKGLAALE